MTSYLLGLYSSLPSVSSATSYVSNAIKSRLPKNDHTKKAAELSQEIQSLESSLTDKTGTVFQNKVSKTLSTLKTEKEKCVTALNGLNGSYYQDPQSSLKRIWDKVVQTVDTAIGYKVERTEQLDEVSAKLKVDQNEAKTTAQGKIDQFKRVEKLRNDRQQQLNKILGTEKTAPKLEEELKAQKEQLQQKHRELCGNYFGDTNGKLDQAWRKYKNGQDTLDAYKKLETERKQIEAQLFTIDQHLAVPATTDRTYEVLTSESITKQVEELKKVQKTESDLSGVDWKKTVKQAAVTTLFAAGYLATI